MQCTSFSFTYCLLSCLVAFAESVSRDNPVPAVASGIHCFLQILCSQQSNPAPMSHSPLPNNADVGNSLINIKTGQNRSLPRRKAPGSPCTLCWCPKGMPHRRGRWSDIVETARGTESQLEGCKGTVRPAEPFTVWLNPSSMRRQICSLQVQLGLCRTGASGASCE